MTKQRVLFITVRSDIGGGPLYTVDFARAATARFDVSVASPLDLPHGPTLKSIGSHHIEIPHRKFCLSALFKLVNFVRDNQIDIVHSHGRGAGLYSRLLKLTGARIVHTYHGIHREPTLIGRIKFWMDRLLQRFTDDYVFVSKSEYNDAAHSGFKVPTDPRIVYPLAPRIWADSPREFKRPVRIGAISRIDYQKGIDLLLQGLVRFRDKFPQLEWDFVLAGGGKHVEIPAAISDRARWIGPTSDPIEFLRTIDVYVAHSRWESFNITVLEALSQGLPALISHVPGHEYFIEEGVATGFKLGNFDDFSDKLAKIMTASKPAPHFDWIESRHRTMLQS